MATTVYAQSRDVEEVAASSPLLVPVGLLVSIGVIHGFAAGEHLAEGVLAGAAFALVSMGQLAAAARMYKRPDDQRTLLAAAVGGTAVALAWVVSRTVGLPFADGGRPEAVGIPGVVATLEELALAVLVLALFRRPDQAGPPAWLASPSTLRVASALLSSVLFVAVLVGHDSCFLPAPTVR